MMNKLFLRKSLQLITTPLAAPLLTLNTADAVEYLNSLDHKTTTATLRCLERARIVKLFEQPELREAPRLLAELPTELAAAVIEQMAEDRAADLMSELDVSSQKTIFLRLNSATRQSIQALMGYAPGTAGALMTTEYVAVPATWTVAQTLEHIRQVERTRETVYAIYLLNAATHTLQNVVTMRRLITAQPDASIVSIAQVNPSVTITPSLDQEEVARLFRRHDLLSIPVVDQAMHLLGIVTVDDVLDALIAETTEDVHKFGGMEALDKPYMEIKLFDMVRKRAGWLSILFIGEMFTASAMQYFEDALSKAVVLTLFIPLIMSSGGNSGSQATSLLIRALALREIQLHDWWKVILRELPTGILLGSILGGLAILRITLWQTIGLYNYGEHWLILAITIGIALIGIVCFGSLSGSMLPFLLQRLGFDPASASAPFVATLVDVTGLVIYFSIALLILHGTLL